MHSLFRQTSHNHDFENLILSPAYYSGNVFFLQKRDTSNHCSTAFVGFMLRWLWFTSKMTIVYITKKKEHAVVQRGASHSRSTQLALYYTCALTALGLGCSLSLYLINTEALGLHTSTLHGVTNLCQMRHRSACLHLSWWWCWVCSPALRWQTVAKTGSLHTFS